MAILDVVQRLKDSNQEMESTLEQLHEQFIDLSKDSRYEGLPMDGLEELFSAYLKTWIKTNSSVIESLIEK